MEDEATNAEVIWRGKEEEISSNQYDLALRMVLEKKWRRITIEENLEFVVTNVGLGLF